MHFHLGYIGYAYGMAIVELCHMISMIIYIAATKCCKDSLLKPNLHSFKVLPPMLKLCGPAIVMYSSEASGHMIVNYYCAIFSNNILAANVSLISILDLVLSCAYSIM